MNASISNLFDVLRCVAVSLLLSSSLYGGMLFPDRGLQVSVDAAQFLDGSGTPYMEIYYAVPERGIAYQLEEDGSFGCQLVMDLQVFFNEELWTNKAWKVEKTMADTSSLVKGSQLVDLLRYQISDQGEYRLVMHIKDMQQPGAIDSAETAFQARPFAQGLRISDLQLSSHIERQDSSSSTNLVKSGYAITPSPSGLFGGEFSNIYYYFEAYGLLDHVEGKRYKSITRLENSEGRTITGVGISYRTKKKINDTSVEIGMVSVANLPSGKYQIAYGIGDDDKEELVIRRKEIFVFNPGVVADERFDEENLGPLQRLAGEEVDAEFKKLIFINTKADREFYKNLNNIEAKRKFLLAIWNRPNEFQFSPATYREQYLGRAQFSDDKFKSVFGKGWKSDRGRVFILYGPPSDIQRFASTEATVPYQIWTYNKLRGQGGVIFVFSDRRGFNKYELLHSSLTGELQDLNWKSLVFNGSESRTFRRR